MKERKISLFDLIYVAVLLLVFLATLNFENKYFYLYFFAFAASLLLSQKITFNTSLICLLVLSLCITLFANWTRDTILTMIKPFVFPLAYIMGCNLFGSKKMELEKSEKRVTNVLMIVSGGMFLHYILNWVSNAGDVTNRNTIDYWTKEVLAATNQAVMAVMALGVSVAILLSNFKIWKKIIALAAVAAIMIYNLTLAGRTLVFMTVILVVAGVIYRITIEKKGRAKFLLGFVGILLILVLLFAFDAFGLRSMTEESLLANRFGPSGSMDIDETERVDQKLNYLKGIWAYPFGGGHFREIAGYAHDIFFDTFDEAGIFAFIAIIIYVVAAASRMVKVAKDKQLTNNFKFLILCTYLACFMMFCLEPVILNAQWMFASFCLIDGATSELLLQHRTVCKKQEKISTEPNSIK